MRFFAISIDVFCGAKITQKRTQQNNFAYLVLHYEWKVANLCLIDSKEGYCAKNPSMLNAIENRNVFSRGERVVGLAGIK